MCISPSFDYQINSLSEIFSIKVQGSSQQLFFRCAVSNITTFNLIFLNFLFLFINCFLKIIGFIVNHNPINHHPNAILQNINKYMSFLIPATYILVL